MALPITFLLSLLAVARAQTAWSDGQLVGSTFGLPGLSLTDYISFVEEDNADLVQASTRLSTISLLAVRVESTVQPSGQPDRRFQAERRA